MLHLTPTIIFSEIDKGDENVALNKLTYQMGTEFGGSSDKAVDGNK